ncbi:EGF and hEGF domain containing protein [Trichuris trichiura]|uniref:EGF and hEGF domain containing protein n=1 Tax=Trichuris trichiura TaxID=36087 RepID=A0A077Z0Z0_TRITR|nr:EGF and hEGF domain containing protein [Trichuris trichiura]
MGWDGVNDTNICKTWLAVNYYPTDEIDILDKAIATCDDLPNGKMLHPRPVDMEEKENETNKVEGVAILPWRLIEKAVKQEESTLTTIITMNMTSGDLHETAMTPEALPSAYKNVNSKNLPMCSFLNKDNTESIDSCKTHDGAVRVLCKSSKLEHCNPDGRKCRCDAGWEGPFCKERENKCKKNSCSSNGICIMNDEGEASCACLPGSTGTECKEDSENDCEQVTCSYHGKCENKLRDFKCKCDPGFTGNFCEIGKTFQPLSHVLDAY